MRPVYCDVCRRDMVTPDGKFEVQGINIKIWSDEDKYLEFTKQLMYPYEPGRQYKICVACWLRSLGVKA